MIEGQRVVAFTPCGRKRFMDLLVPHMVRQHEKGYVDKWIFFNNAYIREDSTYCDQIVAHFPWCEKLEEEKAGGTDPHPQHPKFSWHRPEQIKGIFRALNEGEGTIYLRLDDDIVYIDDNAIPRLVKYRIENPHPYLVYPVIVNNVRTSYHMQQQGIIPKEWGVIQNEMCNVVAHRHSDYVHKVHLKALSALERGKLVEEFTMKTEQFTDWESGYISINCFVMFGRDMLERAKNGVLADEERHLSVLLPQELNRPNARVGDAIIIHFAYHTQTTYMDSTGMLLDYSRFVKPLDFRTVQLSPPLGTVGKIPE